MLQGLTMYKWGTMYLAKHHQRLNDILIFFITHPVQGGMLHRQFLPVDMYILCLLVHVSTSRAYLIWRGVHLYSEVDIMLRYGP